MIDDMIYQPGWTYLTRDGLYELVFEFVTVIQPTDGLFKGGIWISGKLQYGGHTYNEGIWYSVSSCVPGNFTSIMFLKEQVRWIQMTGCAHPKILLKPIHATIRTKTND